MDNTFKTLFGIEESAVQKTCVIVPFDIPHVMSQLGVPSMNKGKLFSVGQGLGLTLIRSGMSAGFVGDCILWLEKSPCQQIFFIGTCGLIQQKPGLKIGTVVTPSSLYAFESFSAILSGDMGLPGALSVDDPLIQSIGLDLPRCTCVSFSSLHEEERYLPVFKILNAEIIEMECNAFFLAARKIQRKAAALLIISDVMGVKTLCFDLSPEDKKSLSAGTEQAAKAVKIFASAA